MARSAVTVNLPQCDLLSHVTLGSGVEGSELHCVRVLGSHLKQNLLEGVEVATLSVHVVLVNLTNRDRTAGFKAQIRQ